MASDYRFETTIEPHKLRQVLSLPGTEWSGKLSAAEFGETEASLLVDFIAHGTPARAFYFETKTGEILACCVTTQHKAIFKEAGTSTMGTVPDPSLFGVEHGIGIRLSYVFVAKEARGQGLMGLLVPRAIEYTEAEILRKELAKSPDRKDSFTLMVQNGSTVDHVLATHYLGKKYVWYLYSAIDLAYARFGFKSYPIEGYRIDRRVSGGSTYRLVEQLLLKNAPTNAGKNLRLLEGDRLLDRQLIDYILQGRQLELITDLNKNVYHSELRGDPHSSLSLTNLSTVLSMMTPGSTAETPPVTAQFKESFLGLGDSAALAANAGSAAGFTRVRRKSSILLAGCPKVGILPEFRDVDHKFAGAIRTARKFGTEDNLRHAKVHGAILTNELQRKLFYILWMLIKGTDFTVVAMGEMNLDMFATLADPRGNANPGECRRRSSLTGLNDMGGVNFQDLDILITAAVYVARKLALDDEGGSVLVNVNDLPAGIPKPLLHDFFLNYLPKAYEAQDGIASAQPGLVQFMNFSDIGVLPMLRKYGSNNADFQLDWLANSLITWG